MHVEPEVTSVKRASAPDDIALEVPRLVRTSVAMQAVLALIAQVGPTNASVLLTGESGTGKELVAHIIHQLSARRTAPFIAINCAALPETLMESELFGHEKGAFT